MEISAYDVLNKHYPVLMEKLVNHYSVCSALQGVFTYAASLAADERHNVTGLNASVHIADDKRREDNYVQGTLVIDFTWNDSAQPQVYVDKKILWQRNLVIAQVMEVNVNIRDLAMKVVNVIEQIGAQYKVPWEDMRCGSKRIIVRRGGHRLEMDIGQREWLADEEPEAESAIAG